MAETIVVTDAAAVRPPVVINVVEEVGVADVIQVLAPVVLSVTETISVGDAPQVVPPVVINLVEAVGVTDLVTVLPEPDTDDDGAEDATEDAAPNDGDGNGDGIEDRFQANVVSLPDVGGVDYLTVETSGGCDEVLDVEALGESAISVQDPVFDYPFGLLRFRLPCTLATVRAIFHGATSLGGPYRNNGPTVPGDLTTIAWYTFPAATFGTETIGGDTVAAVTLALADGVLGDDTAADGEILSTGGPGQICVVPPADLVHWWTGDADASDVQGSEDGVLVNGAAAGAPGRVDGAFRFDGQDDYLVAATDLAPGTGDFTLDAWIRTTETGSDHLLLNSWNGQAGVDAIVLSVGPTSFACSVGSQLEGKANFILSDDAFTVCLASTTDINDGGWHHVAAVRDGATGRLYVDGVEEDAEEGLAGADLSPSGTNFNIGAGDGFSHSAADIDEVEIFARALAPSEIRDLFEAGGAGKCKVCLEVDCSGLTDVCNVGQCDVSTGQAECIAEPRPATTLCRAGSGDLCDADEFCTGVAGEGCPADVVAPAGTVCNPGSGDVCDPDEVCSGVADAVCPADSFEPPTTVCNAGSGDLCDPDETCPGAADGACPADFVEPASTLCRESGTGQLICDPEEFCTGVADAACPDDFLASAGTTCGDQTMTVCTDEDTCDGQGICQPNNVPCAFVTDSELCTFDVSPKGDEVGDRQFRALFTPDPTNWIAYKLNASNPGQFFYNLFYDGPFPATLEVTVPYPFVTQGAMPVHVYDGALVDTNECFVPRAEELATSGQQIAIEDYLPGGPVSAGVTCDLVCRPDGVGSCSFSLSVEAPPSGSEIAYVNVHLDYGLKGPHLDVNPCDDGTVDRYDRGAASEWESFEAFVDTPDDLLLELAIADCQDYEFSHTDGGSSAFMDAVQNLNIFKRISGAFGMVQSSDNGAGVEGTPVLFLNSSTGEIVQAGATDEDGFYALPYKHTGAPTAYTVILTELGLSREVELRGNGWAEVNFDVFTGTSTAVFTGAGKREGN